MKKLMILVATALMLTGAMSAQAGEGMKGGLGFHVGDNPMSEILSFFSGSGKTTPATIGGRQWFNSQVGVDAGVGFNAFNANSGTGDHKFTTISFDIGLPIVVKKFDKVNFIFRPGFQYGTLEDKDETVVPTQTEKFTVTGFSGTFEAEWMVADNLSISAAHGLAWAKLTDDGTPQLELTSVGTTGSNFTQLGFNLYLW